MYTFVPGRIFKLQSVWFDAIMSEKEGLQRKRGMQIWKERAKGRSGTGLNWDICVLATQKHIEDMGSQ